MAVVAVAVTRAAIVMTMEPGWTAGFAVALGGEADVAEDVGGVAPSRGCAARR